MKYFGHICNEIRGSFLKVMNNAKMSPLSTMKQ